MRIASEGQADPGPLLGEIAGRWYWDKERGEFRRNRRHSRRERRRGFDWTRFWRNWVYQLLSERADDRRIEC